MERKRQIWIGLLIAVFTVASEARAATVVVTGAPGGDGAAGADNPSGPATSGESGGAGELANALSDGPDSSNTANAVGGAGGKGGNGGNSTGGDPYTGVFPYGGNGGAGGAGGAGLATATLTQGSAPASAQATSQGGAGGNSGLGGSSPFYGFEGVDGIAGAGGDAESHASATAGSGSASANALATGGNGGSAPFRSGPPQGPFPQQSGGRAGTALADANAVSGSGPADAFARATGANAGWGGGSNASGWANGAVATAHANAETSGAESATATAEAIGGQPALALSLSGASADASARAVSTLGDATATARQTGGIGSAYVSGILVSSTPEGGGAGGNSVMVDKVSGAAGGRLTLSQEATGGQGTPNRDGGSATSELHATNPLGGELVARGIAVGGSGDGFYSLVSSAQIASRGGTATANVTATDTAGSYVEADATARSGIPGATAYYGYGSSGEALAHATAEGLGEVMARANSITFVATHGNAASDALGAGPVAGAHASLDLTPAGFGTITYALPQRELETMASLGLAANPAALPLSGMSEVRVAGAPDAGAVARGSFGSSSLTQGGTHLAGSIEIDLTSAAYGSGTQLTLGFLDPSAAGSSFDLLHLAFAIDGTSVFDTSFADSASAVAGLDNLVVDLGTLGSSNDALRKLVLSFEIDFSNADAEGAFAAGFALMAAAATPEPSLAVLLISAAAALLLHRARVRAGSAARPARGVPTGR